MGKTAYVNLTTGEVRAVPTPPQDLHDWLGGRGLGARLLFELVGPDVDPLAPENVLIFRPGGLSGTPWPASSRLHVTFKSPLTGAYGYANTGGFLGPELAHAGYDALVVSGRAAQPVYLKVTADSIEVLDAHSLWGLTTGRVHDALLGIEAGARTGRVACIGPAGERLVRIAAIINDRGRAAARGGPGAVMGSKNLKAIHVIAPARAPAGDSLRTAARAAVAKLAADPHLDGLRRYGTVTLMDPKNLSGDQPARNHQAVQVPFIQRVNAAALDRYVVRHKACYACPIRCSRDSVVKEGAYAAEVEGPEYETTNALGPMCWVSDPEAIICANRLCNEFGLDTISTGVTIAFAMECHQRGLLDDPELSLDWGDSQTLLGLVERIAYRRGIGDLLAGGTLRAAAQIGPEAHPLAMQVKGMELPRQEPRFAKGFGLGHCTSNRGADHLYAMPVIDVGSAWDVARRIFPESVLNELMDPDNETYKPDIVVYGEHFCAVTDALGLCKFSTVEEYSLLPADLLPGVAALLGEEVTEAGLLRVGERIVNLERLFNVRQGMDRSGDYLPARFTGEPAPLYAYEIAPDGEDVIMSREPVRLGIIRDLDAMLDRYYALRGWSPNGIPTIGTLNRLGLERFAAGMPLPSL